MLNSLPDSIECLELKQFFISNCSAWNIDKLTKLTRLHLNISLDDHADSFREQVRNLRMEVAAQVTNDC